MAIQLDHLIVPVQDKHAAAKRLAALLDVPSAESLGEFVAVFVNDGLTLDFATREGFEGHHVCFRVSDAEFDAIFARIQAAGIKYRSRPRGEDDMRINTRLGGKNLYWQDADGHLWEILTVSYTRPESPAVASARSS
jgi:catechol 2,3-dioxygenase-like lactoylglutathione lyase family enzyme